MALLDEASSNVGIATDSFTKLIIIDDFHGYTAVVVAHWLDTILDSDLIAVLDSGSFIDFNSLLVLLSRARHSPRYTRPMGMKERKFKGRQRSCRSWRY